MSEEYTDPIDIPMLTDATLINTTSDPVPLNNTRQFWGGFTIKAGTTAGVLVWEVARYRDFAGTWDILDSFDIAATIAADAAFATAIGAGDVYKQITTYPGGNGFVRHRLSTAVTGGATHTLSSTIRRKMGG